MRIFFFTIAIFSSFLSFGQKIYSSEKDVFDANEIVFYGYDFSHFKLADAKRFNNIKVKAFIPAWIGYLNKYEDEETLTKRLKKNKVTFDFDYTTNIIKTLKNEDLVSILKGSLSPDSIQNIISRYELKQKEGIGFVLIVECFEKTNETSTVYFTFFDIATRKVLISDYFGYNQPSENGLTRYWGNGLATTFYRYLDKVYGKKDKSK